MCKLNELSVQHTKTVKQLKSNLKKKTATVQKKKSLTKLLFQTRTCVKTKRKLNKYVQKKTTWSINYHVKTTLRNCNVQQVLKKVTCHLKKYLVTYTVQLLKSQQMSVCLASKQKT